MAGAIRVPVPAVLAVMAVLLLLIYVSTSRREAPVPAPARVMSLADFEPVKQLEQRIVRRSNEGN